MSTATESKPSDGRFFTPALIAAVFVCTAVAAWIRLPGTSRGTFWAEDAQIFSARALGQAPMTAWIFTPYDGYVHAVPQLTANLLWWVVPTRYMALAITAAACLIAAAVATLVFVLSKQWLQSTAARLLAAAVTVLLPGLPYEALGNLANIHWFLLWLTPFLFVYRPQRWWSAAALAGIAFAVVTTEVQSAIFAPLLLLHLRDRRRYPLFAAVIAGGALQLWALLGGGRATGTELPSVASVIAGYGMQVPLLGFTGTTEAASASVAYSGWALPVAAFLAFVCCAAIYVVTSERRRKAVWIAGGVIAASVVLWSAGYALNRASVFDFATAPRDVLVAGVPLLRYAILPLMLLFLLVALAVDAASRRGARLMAMSLMTGVALLFGAAFATDVPSPRSQGPTWSAGLDEAADECGEAVEVTDVRVAPLYGEWYLPLPCERLP